MNRTLALTLLTTLAASSALTLAGTAGAADPLCASEHAATDVVYGITGGVASITATARPGCDGAKLTIASYATAGTSWIPTEHQPALGSTSAVLGAAPVTVTMVVPGSTYAGQCNAQVDFVVGDALHHIAPDSMFNEPFSGVDSNGDGLVTNRLIGARYVDQECVDIVEEPPVVVTTPTPPTPVVDGPQVELDAPPPVVVVATPTPAPEPPAVALSETPIVALTSEQMEMLPVTGSARLLPMIALGLGMVGVGTWFQVAAARRNRKAGK